MAKPKSGFRPDLEKWIEEKEAKKINKYTS